MSSHSLFTGRPGRHSGERNLLDGFAGTVALASMGGRARTRQARVSLALPGRVDEHTSPTAANHSWS